VSARVRGGGALVAVALAVAAVPAAAGARTVAEAVRAVDARGGARMRAALVRAGFRAPPRRLWLLAVKDERRLELWAEAAGGVRVPVTSWPVLAASGGAGPKLREGDGQVPEGVYGIPLLNPNSAFHLSLQVGYPSARDRAWARRDGRTRLGGQIFIHGDAVSIGCIAIGDAAIEELFWLAATAGKEAFTVVIVPTDLRRRPAPELPALPWTRELYRELAGELARFPAR
jgi:hypothetical protein